MTTQTYQQDSERFLAPARAELSNGVLAQASEKGWGTAAQMVKAISEQRGWRHRGHALLSEAVDTLADEAGDQESPVSSTWPAPSTSTSTRTGGAPRIFPEG